MSWLEKLLPPKIQTSDTSNKRVPEGVWVKCPSCEEVLYSQDLKKEHNVCPKCNYHLRITARERLDALLDPEHRIEIGSGVVALDTLKFKDTKKYTDRLKDAMRTTGEGDALLVMKGSICSVAAVVACFEFDFMGGSMGSVVGERFARGVQAAIDHRVPFICFSASGGARMQEGLFSLMQMAKTNAMLTQLAAKKLPFISILTDPTMGGVSASFAFMGDIVAAEPNALIGFAGPRVIEQTVREKLPEGFQRAEFLLDKGAIDMILDRRTMRLQLAHLMTMLQNKSSSAISEDTTV